MPILKSSADTAPDVAPFDFLYPVLSIPISDVGAISDVDLQRREDDLGPLASFRADSQGIAVEMQHRGSDAQDAYTMFIDARGVVERIGTDPLHFALQLVERLGLDSNRMTWVNEELGSLFEDVQPQSAPSEAVAPSHSM